MFGQKKKPHINTDKKSVDEILERGVVVDVLPDKEEFRTKLLSGERLRIYIGFDATSSKLHLSHAKNFMLLERFRKLGHEVIVLFGDFTARIGDPSGQTEARKPLSKEEVDEFVAEWKKQIQPLMDFKDSTNPPKILYNSAWLSKLTFEEILSLASNVTVQQMLERDMFEKRINEGKPIHLHEFLYPIMQGYDSVAMEVDAEMCGTDQTFNALVGRTLEKKLVDKEKFVIVVNLMENPETGELMSKSKGTGVFLGTGAHDMFGAIMAQPDAMLEPLFKNVTDVPKSTYTNILKGNPRDAKLTLAKEITTIFYGEKAANEAEKNFIQTFSEGGVPSEMPTISVTKGTLLREALDGHDVVSSKSQFRRLVESGAIKNMSRDTVVDDPNQIIEEDTVFKIGKHRFVKFCV